MTRHAHRLLLLLIVIAAIAATVMYATREKPVTVTLYTVERGDVEAVVANTRAGTIKACRRARLAPATGGQVATLTVKEGDRVEKGRLLVELWNVDLAAEVKLAQSEASASAAKSKEACARADQAQREAERLAKLRKKGVVSEDDLDRAQTEARASQAACEATRAQTSVSRARIEAARAVLERTRLIAPFDGIVAEVNGELGEFVTPSPTGIPTPPTVDLIDESCLFVSAPIDEVDAPEVRENMVARISLDAFAGRHCMGHVQRIAPYVLEVEKQARTVEIEAGFDANDECQGLLPGYSADVEVILHVAKDVLRVPSEAILENDRVLVYRESDEVLEERVLTTGTANWDWTEVIEGVNEGERVVTSVNEEGVETGARARPEPAQETGTATPDHD